MPPGRGCKGSYRFVNAQTSLEQIADVASGEGSWMPEAQGREGGLPITIL